MDILTQYKLLNDNDRDALDETIMNHGITTLPKLLDALNEAQTFLNEQPGAPLTLEQFRGTREAKTMDVEWCRNNGLDEDKTEVFMYEDGCYIIVNSPGEFYLIIGGSEWTSNDLESLEELLYDRFYF